MRKASIVREAADPPSDARKLTSDAKERIRTQMERVWAKMPQVPDSTQIIEEDRSR